jgi:hypothetical protein
MFIGSAGVSGAGVSSAAVEAAAAAAAAFLRSYDALARCLPVSLCHAAKDSKSSSCQRSMAGWRLSERARAGRRGVTKRRVGTSFLGISFSSDVTFQVSSRRAFKLHFQTPSGRDNIWYMYLSSRNRSLSDGRYFFLQRSMHVVFTSSSTNTIISS